jgi:hypothetical protein
VVVGIRVRMVVRFVVWRLSKAVEIAVEDAIGIVVRMLALT